ncbi:MAG: molecular chaperone HtpG [Gammaproteobacteria bacterium]|nr:molecular chaperone HtpG [Gammaproteobacteria bacterium]
MRVFPPLLILILGLVALAEWVRGDDEGASAPSDSVDQFEQGNNVVPKPLDTMSDEFEAQLKDGAESFEFQAELYRLMDIIVHSLYRNKDVFIRELVSNAADALDKIRFLSLSDSSVLDTDPELNIRIWYDPVLNQISIRDTGIGMTKLDLIENLGTVAKSGTSNFVEALAQGGDISQIGQFGVGFYSAYLVADKVQVISKHNNDDQYVWESSASGEFTVSKDPRGNTLGRGTEVVLHLKEESKYFASHSEIYTQLMKRSQFVPFPIHLYLDDAKRQKGDTREKAEDDFENVNLDTSDKADMQQQEDNEIAVDKETTAAKDDVQNYEIVNSGLPIWMRPKENLVENDYTELYHLITGQNNMDPTVYTHFKAEGDVEFTSILYVHSDVTPRMKAIAREHDLYAEIKLYIRKILLADDLNDIIPRYLNFVCGVVDSDALGINVNRENLQGLDVMPAISNKLTRKILEMLLKLAKGSGEEVNEEGDPVVNNKYHHFYELFGNNIKMGLIVDRPNEGRLQKLLRYKTSKSNGEWRSLADYNEGMKEWQTDLYYVTESTLEECEASPFLDVFKERDVEVIYCNDNLDEYVFSHHPRLAKMKCTDISKEGVNLGDDHDKKAERRLMKAYKKKFAPLKDYLEAMYKTKSPLIKVRVSGRPGKYPAIIAASKYSDSAHVQKMYKYQAQVPDGRTASQEMSVRVFYINPRHQVVNNLLDLVMKEDSSSGDSTNTISSLAWTLFDAATVSSGYDIASKDDFTERMYNIMSNSLNIEDVTTLLPQMEIPDDEDEGLDQNETPDLDELFEYPGYLDELDDVAQDGMSKGDVNVQSEL